MSSLQNNNINTTYDGLLKFVDNEGLVTGQKLVTDGLGSSTALTLGPIDAGASITGNITSTGSITSDINITAGGNLTVSGVTRLMVMLSSAEIFKHYLIYQQQILHLQVLVV